MPESPMLPLPPDADLAFWRGEVDRASRVSQTHHGDWQENLDYYTGKSKDALTAQNSNAPWVNVNVDFYQVEQKLAQLFYETPELQISAKLIPTTVAQAHRALMNELLGPDHTDVLTTVQKSIKGCLATAGFGPTKICYQPTTKDVPAPQQPGAILGLQAPVSVPIHEAWKWEEFSAKKYLIPADYRNTDYDKAPWLGMRFRMPLTVGRRSFTLLPEFTGVNTRDDHVLGESEVNEPSGLNYIDGTEIWYRAALFDETVLHPELYRCLVLIDGLDTPAKHVDSPYQELDPQGRLTGDSMIGNPIHVLTVRDVPDAAYVPSDSQMTRPLARELCKFRTQMLQERDANRPRVLFDADAFTPDTIARMESGEIGALIPMEGGKLAAGVNAIMATAVQGNSPRQTYIANDYIEKDIAKTLAIGSNQTSVGDNQDRSATEISVIDRAATVRLDSERRRVLQWYLKGVAKYSALVCRYMTPDLAAQYIGPQLAQAWASWDKKAVDGRMAFVAKPDSQIKLDAASERKFALDLYQMTANDPNINRVALLKNLLEKSGVDPAAAVIEQLPEKKPDGNFSMRITGEDLIAPQAPQVREVLAQLGIKISQEAIDEAGSQMFQQMSLGVRDGAGKAVAPVTQGAEHGGPAKQVRPLSKQQGDETGNRPGPKYAESAA